MATPEIPQALWYTLAALIPVGLFSYHKLTKPSHSLPPGPSAWIPWLGSLYYMPKHKGWEVFERWGKEYNSDILYLRGGNDFNVIILNSQEAVTDLLDKRSAIYSSRPLVSIVDTMGMSYLFSEMPYGGAWLERRKLFQKHFHPTKPETFRPRVLSSTRERLLPSLLSNPEKWGEPIRRMIAENMLSVAYGLPFHSDPPQTSESNAESLFKLSEVAMDIFNEVFLSDAVLGDIIPPLKYFPSWFPGATYKKRLPEWQKLATEFRNQPYDEGKKILGEGKAEDSFISSSLGNREKEDIVKDTAAMVYAGGVDTTFALLKNFIFAMLLHPPIQSKAQTELDQILGHGKRLPEWQDEQHLPYLRSVLKEVIRWRPVVPLGVPHSVTSNDTYKGYHIPKNTIIMPNTWLILHDEQLFGSNTDEFRPERYLDSQGNLNPDVRDPAKVAFGFGRRICPGAHIAQSTLFIVAAHILSVFSIKPVIDEDGSTKEPSLEWSDMVVCPPLPFECQLVPRSDEAKILIQNQ